MSKRRQTQQIHSTPKMNGANVHNLRIAHGYAFLKIAPVLHWAEIMNCHMYSDYAERSLGTWHGQIVEVECHEGDCDD